MEAALALSSSEDRAGALLKAGIWSSMFRSLGQSRFLSILSSPLPISSAALWQVVVQLHKAPDGEPICLETDR